jgi:hypothetical protein
MNPSLKQKQIWYDKYIPPWVQGPEIENFVQDIVKWTIEEIAYEFDRKEQSGAKGYGPSVPAKIVRELGAPAGSTLREMSLRALDNLVLPSQKFSDSYKLLETVLSNIPESPTNTR